MTEAQNKDIVIYQSKDGNLSFDVNVFEETVWLTQKQMAELFEKSDSTVKEHIKNVYDEDECDRDSTSRKFRLVQKEGGRVIERNVDHYNLDMIISVGYRIKSKRGIQFRQWATKILKQYMLNGYAVNEVRIKKIESSLDELVASHKLLKGDVDGIKNLLLKLIERPIVIHSHNQISLGSAKLEEKIIELLDQIMEVLGSKNKVRTQIEELKNDIKKLPQDDKAKNRLARFLKDMGDSDSDTYKIIKGAGVAKKIISELVKLGEKLKDLI